VKKKNDKKSIYLLVWGIAVITSIIVSVCMIFSSNENVQTISYTEYLEYLESNEVDMVTYSADEGLMTVRLFDEQSKKMTFEERKEYKGENAIVFKTYYPAYEDFRKDLLEKDVIVNIANEGAITYVLLMLELMPSMLLIFFFSSILLKSFPSSTDHFEIIQNDKIDIGFDDVIGHEEVKEDLRLLVKQLKNGVEAAELSHGILLEGGAGTGKTMLAKAVAKEAGVNFISVNSSNLIALYVGMGAQKVREAFKIARKNTPCILFFDEIDAIGRERGNGRGTSENDQTINAMLTELDGFQTKGDVIVIAATNRADNLDKALLRSGRFDRRIKIEAPKKWETRQKLFEHYLKNDADESVDSVQLAKEVVGFSGADIASVCREAKLIAFREDKKKISQDNLQEAIDKIVFKGNRSNEEQHAQDLEVVAFHEAGHAVVSLLRGEEISRVSIHGMTSGVGGAVFQADDDRLFVSKRKVVSRIMIAYAGRASEEIHYGDENVTEGAGSDITQATKLLMAYVTKFGFDKSVGFIDLEVLAGEFQTNETVIERVKELSKEMYQETLKLLKENYDMVEVLAKKLLEVKTMSGEEVDALMQTVLGAVS